MFQASKTFAASILAMAYIGGCANTTSQGPLNSLSSMDNSRNVLSFADTLDTVLPSVVRIGTVKTNKVLKAGKGLSERGFLFPRGGR